MCGYTNNCVGYTHSSYRYLSRHELEFEQSITHDKVKACRLLQLTTQQKQKFENSKDPINHLDEIWKDLTYKQMKTKQIIKQQSKQHLLKTDDNIRIEPVMNEKEISRTGKHDCDRECYAGRKCEWQPMCQVKRGRQVYCRSGGVISAVKSSMKSDVKTLNDTVTDIPDTVITRYKLSTEQIRQIPRFNNYDKGKPSSVCTIQY